MKQYVGIWGSDEPLGHDETKSCTLHVWLLTVFREKNQPFLVKSAAAT